MISMSASRPGARRLVAGVALPVALLVVSACGDDAPEEPAVPNEQIAAEIERLLSGREDVAAVEVTYLDEFTNPSTVTADITMRPGADARALSEEGVRLLWESRLDPLTSLAVYVNDPEDPPAGVTRVVSFTQEAERRPLEERYGPRPD